MRIEIEIPKEFETHFTKDRFEGSLNRLRVDAHSLAGNYEKETAIMLIEAFKNAKMSMKTLNRVEAFKQNFNRQEFFKTELGGTLDECIKAWDLALEDKKRQPFGSHEYRKAEESINWCGGMFEGIQTAFRHFYGVEIHFSRTDDYFGICIADDNNDEFFLTKIDRKDFEEKNLPRFQKEPTIKERAR
jgi:hypothetical protein